MNSYHSQLREAPLFLDTEREPEVRELEGSDEDHDPPEGEDEIKAAAEEPSDDAVKLYLADVRKTKLLSAAEERDLAARIALGDKAARERMIVSNLRLVVKIAKRYMYRGLPLLDLIEEGNLGLIKAVEGFKLSRGCRLSTYATWWIRQSVERALVNQSRTIRLPVHVSDQIKRMQRVTYDLGRTMSREPTLAEVAESMGTTESNVRRLVVLLRKTYSIDQPMGDQGDFFLTDTIEDTTTITPDSLIEGLESQEKVSRLIGTFTDTEKKVLALRFGLEDGDPQTLDTIGRGFGVTRERIRQIESRSLRKLRVFLESRDDGIPFDVDTVKGPCCLFRI
jgi:RNA polymerase primary sigma factor